MKKRYLPIRIMKESFLYERKDFLLLLCSFIAQSIVFSCSPYFVELFVDSIQKSTSFFVLSFLAVSVILFLKPLVNYFNVLIINIFCKKMKMHYASIANRKVVFYSCEDFEKIECSEKIHLGIDGATSACLGAVSIPSIFTFFIPYFVFLSIYFYQTKPIFGLIALIVFVPIVLSQCVRTLLTYKLHRDIVSDELEEKYFEKLLIQPQSLKEIRILQEKERFLNIYHTCLKNVCTLKNKSERKLMFVSLFCDFMSLLGLSVTIYVLVYSVIDRSITMGAFIAVLSAILEMFNWMSDLANYDAKDLFNRLGSIIHYYDFIDQHAKEVPQLVGSEITFKDVSYQYANTNHDVLKNINIRIKQNDRIAIVGKNGSGKSTLVNLILGLYKPTRGSIERIESVDKLSKASAVFQNYSKYKLSLKSNITIGEELKRSDDCLRSQLEKIHLNQRECTLDTVLSSEFDGIDLSKGQWQKVAILRGQRDAFNLLVLDEPTSSIDPLQEADVIHYFETMSQNSTLILVTHRLNAIRFVHRIFVLDEGVIVEDGTHVELMEKQGLYNQMYSEQRDKFHR